MNPELVLYRDETLLAVNKPAGVPVHGSKILADRPETLLSLVRAQTGKLVHTAHRLDRPVSGVMALALNRETLASLGKAFEQRQVRKYYLAVVRGWPQNEGTISHPLQPPRDERSAQSPARPATTHFERIAKVEIPVPVHPYPASRYSLLALRPESGRRHQLRRHMKHISHHLIGDTTYGRGEHNRIFRESYGCERLLLHAWSLRFSHPSTHQDMYFEAPLDPVFSSIIRAFDWLTPLEDWQKRISSRV